MNATQASKNAKEKQLKILANLMKSDHAETFTMLALHLRSRERTARITDVSQMLSIMRTQFKKDVPHEALITVLNALEESGLGKLETTSGRKKFIWNFWIFPVMNLKTNTLHDFTFLPLEELQKDKTRFRKIKDQITENELRRAAESNEASIKLKSQIAEVRTALVLSSVSLEDLLEEIKNRGFKISIDFKNKKLAAKN